MEQRFRGDVGFRCAWRADRPVVESCSDHSNRLPKSPLVIGSFRTALPTVTCPERSVSRESGAAAKRKATAHASITPCWRHPNTEVPMPVVRNEKSRAEDFCDGGWRGRGRHAKFRLCSCFVLCGLAAAVATWAGTVDVRISISLATALPTVNGPERSVSRESGAAAKRKATAHASITPCWRQVSRA
jgi:hypothetical protein